MTMPGMAGDNSANRQMTSVAPQGMPAHAILADMGACARQSCDQAEALASKVSHSTAAQFETISKAVEFSHTESLRTALHNARDDITLLSPVVHTSLDVSLRI
jgi:hypothetical protein